LANTAPARLTSAEGRKFGLTVGTAFLVLGALTAWRGRLIIATMLGVLGAGLFLAGVAIPQRLGPVQRGWMAIAVAISKVTTPIIMAVVYYLVLTPTGILRRTLGQSPLRLGVAENTLWRGRSREPRSDLTRQF
jgi:saxitoxin biosynthesis operon SxtJ-like protein